MINIKSKLLDEILNYPNLEWAKLEEVTEMRRGTTLNAKNAVPGSVPVISGGQSPAYYHNLANRVGELITIAGSGAYAGYIMFWDIPVYVNDAFSIKVNSEFMNIKYVYHFLLMNQTKIYNMQRGSGVPHVYPKDVGKLEIPIPPLLIQQKIVDILDKFTMLTAELTAELTARKQQYEYYRDELLTFGDDVEWLELINACDYVDYRGKTPKKTESGIYLVTAKNIKKGFIDYEASKEYISEEDYDEVMRRGKVAIGDVLITTEAPCGNVAQVDRDKIALAQRVIKYRSKNNQKLNNSFLKYILIGKNFQKDLDRIATGSTVRGVKGSLLHKLKIPIPALDEQIRIVEVLDKFDALTNSITEGLPREIELREQQYEYYRDLLLSFPKPDEVK